MGKRRLSQQQRQRIDARQKRHVQHAQDHASLQDLQTDAELNPGLVVANVGKNVIIETETGDTLQCHLRQNMPVLVPGDRIVWHDADNADSHVVVALEPRDTTLVRFNQKGDAKPIAANLQQLLIVFAVTPPPHWSLIDRYIVLAHHLGFEPILVLNKLDLMQHADAKSLAILEQQVGVFASLGYRVLRTCAASGDGVDDLKHCLQQQCSSLVGQSGVGKSALAALLLPNTDIKVADDDTDTIEMAKLGKHTTTTARLYHLPSGGDLIDCPGVRVMHASGLTLADVQTGFKEIDDLAEQCKFNNCQHQQTHGCAVQAGLSEGQIDARRWQSFAAMCAEIVS